MTKPPIIRCGIMTGRIRGATTKMALDTNRVTFRIHALRRMFQRQVDVDDVLHVLRTGEVIEDYSDDTPYPSCLLMGSSGGRVLHVVAARNQEESETTVITVYEPDPEKWDFELRRRRL